MSTFNIDKRFIEILNQISGSSITYSQFSEAYRIRRDERPAKRLCRNCGALTSRLNCPDCGSVVSLGGSK